MISKIYIENVKGFGVPGKTISVQLDSSKVNLCVAPNGFGKSSLATAFESLRYNKIDVSTNYKNVDHKEDISVLTVTMDGRSYTANSNINELSKVLKAHVIHNRTTVDYTKKHFRKAFAVNAYMYIEDIDAGPCVKDCTIKYDLAAIRRSFGEKKGILTDISEIIGNESMIEALPSMYNVFRMFEAKKRTALVEHVKTSLQGKKETATKILENFPDDVLAGLEAEPAYGEFVRFANRFFEGHSKYEYFNLFYQLRYLWKNHANEIHGKVSWIRYKKYKHRLDANLQLLNSTGRVIQTEERNGRLLVVFPHANQISNGQRDVLTFAAELMIFRSKTSSQQKHILIIDEVFDYLDDANTLAAQYYLSHIVRENKGNIYIMLLTHLNPFSFRNYVFNKKLMNEVYLESSLPQASDDMKAFIAFRQWLNPQSQPTNRPLYDKLSCNIYHYNPNAIDVSADIADYHQRNVKSNWGKPSVFRTKIIQQLNLYFSGASVYDPYAVSIALRHKVEKKMYEHLSTQVLKDKFIETYKTNDKLEFCEQNNIVVPDAFYIVNAIHNSADHLKQNSVTGEFDEKQMVYKLQNRVVRHVLELFGYTPGDIIDVKSIE